jgi:hypothetical protein
VGTIHSYRMIGIKQRRGLYAQLIERDKPLEHSAQHGQTGNEEGSVRTYTHGIAKHVQRKKISSTSALEVWRVDRMSMCLGSGNCPKHAVDHSRERSTCQTQVSGRSTIVNN